MKLALTLALLLLAHPGTLHTMGGKTPPPPTYPKGIFQVGCGSGATNPNIKGCVDFLPWSSVDTNGKLDWSAVDATIQVWAAQHKQVALVLWAVADNVSIHATPAYVLANLPKQVSCTVSGGTGYAPDFLSANFQTPYIGFINAVVYRYGNDPRVGFIRVGLGAGGEVFPPCKAQMEATYHMTQTAWTNYLTGMIGAVRHSQGVPLMVGLDGYGEPCLTPQTQAVPNAVATAAIANGWGIGKESLQKSDMLAYQKGQPVDANWCYLFKQNPKAFLDNQMAVGTCANNACPVGSLATLLPWAKSLGVDVVEVLSQDVNNAANAGAIAAFNQ